MFTKIFALLFTTVSLAHAGDAKTFLLFGYGKSTHQEGASSLSKEYKYKVALDARFLAEFKNKPSQTSMGTLFHCLLNDGYQTLQPGGIVLSRFISPGWKNKVTTWAFVLGSQRVKGQMIWANQVGATSFARYPSWNSIEDQHSRTFVVDFDSVGVDYSVESVGAHDPRLQKALVAPVFTANGSVLVPGDPQTDVNIRCSFQEG